MNSLKIKYLNGSSLLTNQFIAMLLKKNLSLLRSWYLFVLQILLPVALLIITVLTARNLAPKTTFPSLKMSLDSYIEPVTLLENNTNTNLDIYKKVLEGHQVKIVTDLSKEILQLVFDKMACF